MTPPAPEARPAAVPLSDQAPAAVRPAAVGRPGLLARLSAEGLGTLLAVVIGLGVPMFAVPQYNPLPAPLAAGLGLTAAMLAFGYLSGGHFNPAVTVGHMIAGRTRLVEGAAYVGAQLVGALLGALALFGVLRTVPKLNGTQSAFDTVAAGFDSRSIIQAPMPGVLLVEVLGAALLVAVFLGTSAGRNPARTAAPYAVGLSYAGLLQLGQSIGNTPFNPARATASALFSSPDALSQLWLFWVAPLVGAAVAGLVFRGFSQAAVGASDAVAADSAAAVDPNVMDLEVENPEGGNPEAGDLESDGTDVVETTPTAPAKAAPARADEARDFFDKRTP